MILSNENWGFQQQKLGIWQEDYTNGFSSADWPPAS